MAQPDKRWLASRGIGSQQFLMTSEIAENLHDGFCVISRDWRYLYLNAAAERILGRSREELLGKVIWDEFPTVLGTSIEAAWRQAMDDRTTGHAEAFYPEIGWVEEHAYPSDEGIWIIFQNITERKDHQRELEETAAALKDAVQELTSQREMAERVRRETEEAARWTTFFAEAEHTLASSLDDRAIHDTLVHLAVPALADAAGVMEIGEDGMVRPIALALSDPEREQAALERLRQHPMDPDLPFGLPFVLRTGEPELVPLITDDFLQRIARDEEHLKALNEMGISSSMVVPLIARERVIAAIWFVSTTPERRYDSTDLSRAQDLAGRAALAIDNALLFKDVERGERNASFVSEASAILGASLDYEASLQNLARLVIPSLADFCMIDIVDNSIVRRVATAHYDPALEEVLRETKRFPPELHWSLTGKAIQTGESNLIPVVTDELRDTLFEDTKHRELIALLNPGSYMLVPLTARGHTFGVITFAGVDGRRRFNQDDLALAEDLAHRAALMIDNARLYREAVEANRAKSDFLAVISHELRTPLNAIMGYTGLLEAGIAGELNPEQASQLHRIDVSARHLLDLIEEVLTYSRMEMGREKARIRTADLGALIREVAGRIEPGAREKELDFQIDLPPGPLMVRTDAAKLRQIITNLLSNAVKFTDRGQVRISAWLTDSDFLIEVADTGIGISPEEQSKIFDPFWQFEQGTTRRVSGTGLGLSVSYRLTRLLNGEITVASTPGEGSTFTLRFPRGQLEEDDEGPPTEDAA